MKVGLRYIKMVRYILFFPLFRPNIGLNFSPIYPDLVNISTIKRILIIINPIIVISILENVVLILEI